jgi:formate dehydrogenase accessory protein FdhE
MAGKEISGEKERARYSQFHQEVMGIRSAFKGKHHGDIKMDDEIIERRSREGKHLIDAEKIEINEKLLNELFQDFLPVLKKHETFFDLKIQDLEEKKEKIDLRKLVRSVLVGDAENLNSFAGELNLNPDLLLFFGLNLSQTFLELYAQKLKEKIDYENWLKGNCPLCGSFPAMEKLRREDGKRILWCGLCGTQWHHKRIMCPFCGNEDHNTLRYFFAEGDSSLEENPFRVDVCDKCKKYIKTIDERKMPDNEFPDFFLEHINTVYLDILAQKDGYESPTYLKTQISGWIIAPSEKESV